MGVMVGFEIRRGVFNDLAGSLACQEAHKRNKSGIGASLALLLLASFRYVICRMARVHAPGLAQFDGLSDTWITRRRILAKTRSYVNLTRRELLAAARSVAAPAAAS